MSDLDGHWAQLITLGLNTVAATGVPASIAYSISHAYWKTHQRKVKIETPDGIIEVDHADDLAKAQLFLESTANSLHLKRRQVNCEKPTKIKTVNIIHHEFETQFR